MADEGKAAAQKSGKGEAKTAAIPADRVPFQIHTYDAVCFWKWSIGNETCAICRNKLAEPSIQYIANPNPAFNNGLKVAFGCCDHAFHLDCIGEWLKNRTTCPICTTEWDQIKVDIIPGYENEFTSSS